VADAMVILKVTKSEIDWGRLLLQAQKCRVTMPLRETVAYLRDKFDAPVSAEILKALQNTPVSKKSTVCTDIPPTPQRFCRFLVKLWLINCRG